MRSPLRNVLVGLRCDAGHRAGVGHAVRLLALAEELQRRGARVVLLGTLDVAWLREAYAAHDIDAVAAPASPTDLTALADRLGLTAIVLDRYDLDPATGACLRAAGRVVLAMVDDSFGAAQEADLYVDQNLGARPHGAGPVGSTTLAGIEYALFRDSVLDRVRTGRPSPVDDARTPTSAHRPARVLAVFGGTDPFGAAPVLTPLLLQTGLPLDLTVVTPDPGARAEIEAFARHDGQTVNAVGPLSDLPAVAAAADLVVSASGSSVWELLCLGVPTAAVCVVDNQQPGYTETVRRGVVAGLGRLDELRADEAAPGVEVLRDLIREPAVRDALAARGRHLVDGHGRQRVADALQRVLERSGT